MARGNVFNLRLLYFAGIDIPHIIEENGQQRADIFFSKKRSGGTNPLKELLEVCFYDLKLIRVKMKHRMLLDVHVSLRRPNHLRIMPAQERVGNHQQVRVEIIGVRDIGKFCCHLPDEKVSRRYIKRFVVAEKRHRSTLAEQMYVVVRMEGLRMDEIGKDIINQVVLHHSWPLCRTNISIFQQNGKIGKSFSIQGNNALGKAPYLRVRKTTVIMKTLLALALILTTSCSARNTETPEINQNTTLPQLDKMLARLGLEYLDLVYLHQPLGDYNGAWKELEKALEMGKVRAIGISDFDFNDELFESIVVPAKVKPQMFQIECHPYAQREHWQEMAAKYNIQIESWFPLGGRDSHGEILRDPVINAIAKAHGKSAAQVIIRWHLQKGFCVVPGSSNPAHIQENIESFGFALSGEEMNQIAALNKEKRYFNMSYEQIKAWMGGYELWD